MLELINSEDSTEMEIIVLKLDEKPVTIGTSEDADLCFIDHTIDDIHCEITLKGEKLFISDN